MLMLKISNGALGMFPVLAQAITTVTTSDKTFGGLTTLLVNGFWAFMLLVFVVGVVGGCVGIAMSIRQQEVPVTMLIIVVCMLALPALAFIIANMVGLGPVTAFFNSGS